MLLIHSTRGWPGQAGTKPTSSGGDAYTVNSTGSDTLTGELHRVYKHMHAVFPRPRKGKREHRVLCRARYTTGSK